MGLNFILFCFVITPYPKTKENANQTMNNLLNHNLNWCEKRKKKINDDDDDDDDDN